METTVPIAIGLTALVLLCMGAILDDRRARARRRAQHDERDLALPLLHSINEDRCIGCEACIDVCPTEVLDLVDHKVKVSRFSDCVQCEQCANSCPTQALVMYRQGTTPRMLTVPELDETFQTGVPGQYLIGEVAGKPLVKNAANLGRAVVEHIVRTLAGAPAPAGVLDVAIVGSGPGGLSAGLTCLKHKLSCVVLEKEHVMSSTVSRYPKGKHFMAEPCTSQNVSYLPVFDGTKEQLIDAWKQVIDAVKLPIKLGEAVETVARGDDGVFTIKSTVATYRARTVVLATGLRGKPRLLVVPGANLEKVQSLLDDPAEFAGQHVLVVGGGDSAVEGAIALAEVDATVTLSYRGDGFKRCKQANQKRLAEMAGAGRLSVLLESNVKRFTPDAVTIALADRSETTLPNQQAFVLIGADTPIAWLETNNVRFVERPHLYALGSTEEVVRRFAPHAAPCPHTPAEAVAILSDRPVPRAAGQRMRSVAQHLRDEFRDVVTSVSAVFRISELEPPRDRRAMTRTPARGVAAAPLIPASRLTGGQPTRQPRAATIRPAPFGPEPDAADPAPIRPRSPQRRPTTRVGNETVRELAAFGRDFTTDAVPSLRSLERAAGLPSLPRAPQTDEMASLRRALDAPTDETASLRARERNAQQIGVLRSREDNATEEVASLRALESGPELATQVETPSLRARERATPAERPAFPRTLRSATSAASSYAMPVAGNTSEHVDGAESVLTSAPRSAPRPRPTPAPAEPSFAGTAPSAAPPSIAKPPASRVPPPSSRPPGFPRAGSPDVAASHQPPAFPRPGSPGAGTAPSPRAAAAAPVAVAMPPSRPRVVALPPPLPHSARFPRGSEGMANPPPAMPSEPQGPDAAGPDRRAIAARGRARPTR